jgi:ABC-2 type transport system permease protein
MMLRYLRLFGVFLKTNLLAELEYRSNFLAQGLMGLFWTGITFASVALFYSHTQALGGWRFEQALVIVGLFVVIEGLLTMLFEPNLKRVVEMVRDGTMDFVLLKPVSSQFMATLRHAKFSGLVDIFAGTGVIVYALARQGYVPGASALAQFVLMFGVGLLIVYSLWLMMAASSFLFVKIDQMQELFRAFWDTARFPISAFPGALRIALTFVLPIAFMTTIPAQALLGTLAMHDLLLSIAMGSALFVISTLMWRRTVRNYSSASS